MMEKSTRTEDGNCFCFFPGFCCTGHLEVAQRSWWRDGPLSPRRCQNSHKVHARYGLECGLENPTTQDRAASTVTVSQARWRMSLSFDHPRQGRDS